MRTDGSLDGGEEGKDDGVIGAEGRHGVLAWPAEWVVEGVREHYESELHCETQSGGELRLLRGEGEGRFASGSSIIVNVHFRHVAIEMLCQDLHTAGGRASGQCRAHTQAT